jgi:murein DD-endopeptidase MepM/ murein hydrolase activator NlpD
MATENPDKRIYQQIEESADFYEPAVYELLRFHQSLELQTEPLDGQFLPMSDVQYRSPKDTKIFAVGLIPPSTNVTGRLLDRSATVRALEQGDAADLPTEEPDVRQDAFLVRPNAGVVEQGSLSAKFHDVRNLRAGGTKLHQGVDIAAPLGAEIRAASDGTIVSMTADGVRSGYGNTIIIQHTDGKLSLYAHLRNFGNVSIGTKVVGGTVVGYVGQTSSPNPMPQPHLHFEVLARLVGGGPAKFDGVVVNRTTPERLEPQAWLASKNRSVASSKSADAADFQKAFTSDGSPASAWSSTGSDNSQQYMKTMSKSAGKDMNQANLGKRFMAQQQATIKQMLEAIDQMANTPPLRLLVNPQSFKVSAEKIISDGNWTRSGPVIEHWGENRDKIEGSGKIAAFYAQDIGGNGPGLTRTARQFSQSYQNLLSLWLIYKNNGGVWFPDPIVPEAANGKNLSVVGSVYLYYDEILYVGTFDTFTLTESETAPFTLEYSFAFSVRAWYLLDHLDDPQYLYGQANIPTLETGTGGAPTSGGNNAQESPGVNPPAGTTFAGLIDDLAAGRSVV